MHACMYAFMYVALYICTYICMFCICACVPSICVHWLHYLCVLYTCALLQILRFVTLACPGVYVGFVRVSLRLCVCRIHMCIGFTYLCV